MTVDTPVTRADLRNMSQADYEQWLLGVRERQMANRKKYEDVERAKSLARVDMLSPKLEKKLASLVKKMDKIDADVDKIAALINEVSTLRQEIDVELKLARSDHPELQLQRDDRGGEGVSSEGDAS